MLMKYRHEVTGRLDKVMGFKVNLSPVLQKDLCDRMLHYVRCDEADAKTYYFVRCLKHMLVTPDKLVVICLIIQFILICLSPCVGCEYEVILCPLYLLCSFAI